MPGSLSRYVLEMRTAWLPCSQSKKKGFRNKGDKKKNGIRPGLQRVSDQREGLDDGVIVMLEKLARVTSDDNNGGVYWAQINCVLRERSRVIQVYRRKRCMRTQAQHGAQKHLECVRQPVSNKTEFPTTKVLDVCNLGLGRDRENLRARTATILKRPSRVKPRPGV